MLARAVKKGREFAVRVAVGASRLDLVRQVLTESMIVALAGGTIGILLAFWGTGALTPLLPANISLGRTIAPNLRAAEFTACLAVLTGLMFGIVPALRNSHVDVAHVLKDESTGIVSGGRAGRVRNGLVVIQVALSLMLLVGAALLLTTLKKVYDIDLGFSKERLLLVTVNPTLVGYSADKSRDYYERLQHRVESLPGVRDVALALLPVIGSSTWSNSIQLEGRTRGDSYFSRFNWVSPGYFKTLGVPVVGGREVDIKDSVGSPKVAVVNETFARRWFGGSNPVGRRFGLGGKSSELDIEIIGVAKDIKYRDMQETPEPTAYFPYTQGFASEMTLHVRMAGPISTVVTDVRRIIRDLDSLVPVYEVKTLETQINENATGKRLMASLTAFFGAVATLMAAIGVYGVLAFSVASRTREIGIRMALGAHRTRVLWMVMRQTMLLIAIGLALGLLGSWGVNRHLSMFLYDVKPMEPAPVAVGVLIIALVAALSGYVPALRASRTNPTNALRHE
jgi:predicted permease